MTTFELPDSTPLTIPSAVSSREHPSGGSQLASDIQQKPAAVGTPTSIVDQPYCGILIPPVGDGTLFPSATVRTEAHTALAEGNPLAEAGSTPDAQIARASATQLTGSQYNFVPQPLDAAGARTSPEAMSQASSHVEPASGEPDTPAAKPSLDSHSIRAAGTSNFGDIHFTNEVQNTSVVAEPMSAGSHSPLDTQWQNASGGFLRDPILGVLAEVVDDLETVRIANSNRVRILTRNETDSDGEERGFGLTDDHPEVAKLILTVKALGAAEADAVKNLERAMKKHPLGAFVGRTKGLGLKQCARLLAAIGDPYYNDLHERPRTVGELWAYAGFHVIKTSGGGHTKGESQNARAAAGTPPHPDSQSAGDTQGSSAVGVAPKRAKGQKANWSETARKRAWLIAAQCVKVSGSPYRVVYDDTRAKYAEAVHDMLCVRCGPKNKPAQPGSSLSAGHQHARALRAMAKALLKDLWIESRALHETRMTEGGYLS